MEWLVGQKFLADHYNKFRDQYVWYLEIVDFESNNNDGDIDVDVELMKYDEDGEEVVAVSCPQSALIDEVNDGELEPIDELEESQKTNVPEDRLDILEV